eukprot:3014840-Pyramimonas_sp.AAC.1
MPASPLPLSVTSLEIATGHGELSAAYAVAQTMVHTRACGSRGLVSPLVEQHVPAVVATHEEEEDTVSPQ